MSIKFFCQCGKRLRARDEMAGRRSMCPRCGNPVGIPALQSSRSDGRLGPMTPAERLKARRQPSPDDCPAPTGPPESFPATGIVAPYVRANLIRQVFSGKSRIHHRRGMENHWYECLLFPLRALPLIILLAAAFAVMMAVATILAGRGELEPALDAQEAARWLWLAIPILVVAYACGFLDCTLASAAAGELPIVRWPGRNVSIALKSLTTWLACFLAGPIIPAGIFVYYWSQSGDLELLDWLILAELATVTIGYWLLAIVTVSWKERLLDANPVQMVLLVQKVGIRLPVVLLLAGLGFSGFGVLALKAIELLHMEASGLLLLLGAWFGALFLAAFLFRLVGLWCYQSGPADSPSSSRNLLTSSATR